MEQEEIGYCKHLSYARIAIAEEMYEEALQHFDNAINSSDAGNSVYYLKCELLFSLSRIDEAVTLMTKHGQEQDNVSYTFYLTSKHFEYRAKMDESAFWWKKYQDRLYGRDQSPEANTKKHLTLITGEKK